MTEGYNQRPARVQVERITEMAARQRTRPEHVTLSDVKVVGVTEKAIKIRWTQPDDIEVEQWMPRSVCIDGDTLVVGDTDVVAATWFVEKEDLPHA